MSGNLCPWQGRQKSCRGQRKWVLLLALDFDWVLPSGYKHTVCTFIYTSIIKLTQITFFKSNHEVKAWSCRPYILKMVFISTKVLTWIRSHWVLDKKKRKTKCIYRKLMNNLVWEVSSVIPKRGERKTVCGTIWTQEHCRMTEPSSFRA